MSDAIDSAIDELTDAGLLTERQAEAFVFRDVEAVPREATADAMGVSPSTLDKHLSRARELVEQAQETARAVESIRHEDLPTRCAECRDGLGSPYTHNEAGEAICLDCAGIKTNQ